MLKLASFLLLQEEELEKLELSNEENQKQLKIAQSTLSETTIQLEKVQFMEP